MTWKDTLNLPVSAQGEWAAKRFYGDPKLAAAYLPVAYALLGEVKNRMAYGGVSFGHRAIELPDGTRIRVIRNGEQNILEIETVPVVGREGFLSSSSSGLVFRPRINDTRVYPRLTPHALMVVTCEEAGKMEFTVSAPAKKEYGNQFVFFGTDVYSWDHSAGGDLAHDDVGEKVVYKNGVQWATFTHGVCGFCPVEVEITLEDGRKTQQMRYLVATSPSLIVHDVQLIAYIEEAGELIQLGEATDLFEDKTAYYSGHWPCRFKSDGSEAAKICTYGVGVELESGETGSSGDIIYTTPETRSRTVYAIVRLVITHTNDGVEIEINLTNEGYAQEWTMRRGSNASVRTVEQFPSSYPPSFSPPPNATSFSVQADASRSVEDTAESIVDFDDIEFSYPIALNYKKTSSGAEVLAIAYYKEYYDLRFEERRHELFTQQVVVDYRISRPNTNVSWTTITDTGKSSSNMNTERSATRNNRRKYQIVVDGDVLVEYQVDGGSGSHRKGTRESTGYGNARFSDSFGGYRLGEYSEATISSNLLYSSVFLMYLDIRNLVILLNYVYSKNTTKTDVSANKAEYYGAAGGGLPSTSEATTTETISAEAGRELKFRNGNEFTKTVGPPPTDTSNTTTTAEGRVPHFYGSPDFRVGSSNSVRTFWGPVFIPHLRAYFRPRWVFSYVKDERIKCPKDVWAYSIKFTQQRLADPFIETVCTFGEVGQYLPALDAEGEPTGGHLADPILTTHPIGLF